MTIPFNTTTITVTRVEEPTGWYDDYQANPPAPTTVIAGVRAVISPPSGTAKLIGGDRIVYNAQLRCDPCDLQPQDTVTDTNGTAWTVLTVSEITGFGTQFMNANVRMVEGAAP